MDTPLCQQENNCQSVCVATLHCCILIGQQSLSAMLFPRVQHGKQFELSMHYSIKHAARDLELSHFDFIIL